MTINTPMKIIFTIFLIGMIALLFWLFDWQAKSDKIKAHSAHLVELQQKLEEHNEMVRDLPVLTKKKADLEAKLQQVVRTNLVPEKAEMFVANYIMEIEKLTAEERERMGDPTFEIESITPGVLTQSTASSSSSSEEEGKDEEGSSDSTPDALKQFPTRMFQMSMRGRYSTLIDFLYQLGALRLERLVTINKIALSPKDAGEPGIAPTLSITIPITAYMRQGG